MLDITDEKKQKRRAEQQNQNPMPSQPSCIAVPSSQAREWRDTIDDELREQLIQNL